MRKFWIVNAAALMLAACGQADKQAVDGDVTDEAKSEPDTGGIKSQAELQAEFDKRAAENLAASAAFLEENATRDGVTVTASGLQFMALEEGPDGGVKPVSTDRVVVHYAGTLKDGVEFDSSIARGAAATFALNRVIPAWTEGVQLMSEGDKYRFFVPPELGYGKFGSGPVIGPNEALIFDVELIAVQNPERNLEKAEKFLADNGKKDGVTTTPSGLQFEVITKGDGEGGSPEATDIVEVHYQGTLLNGTEFDSSYARGESIEFPLNRVIAGWTEGVQLMSEGDKYRFFVHPDLGYGEGGTPGGPIGPNEALVFEVELIAVK